MKSNKKLPVKLALLAGSSLVLGGLSANESQDEDRTTDNYYLAMGGSYKKSGESSCGGESKCGGEKKSSEGKCGGKKKSSEGKCGEGKCG